MRYWVANNDTTNLCVGSTVGPNIFVKICAWSTAQISRELIKQVMEEFGRIPRRIKLLNCVGGGSSAMGFWNEFMDTDAEFIGVEAGGPKNSKHAAPLTNRSRLVYFTEQLSMLFKIKKVRLIQQNLFQLA